MALQPIPSGLSFPRFVTGLSAGPNLTTTQLTLDAADEGVAFVVQAPKGGSIAKVGWGTRTVTTGATVDVRVETLDESAQPARPTGTLWGTSTNGAQVVAATDDNVWFLTPLTAPAVVAKGDLLAIIVKNPAAAFGNLQISGFPDDGNVALPYTLLNTGVSPAVSWGVILSTAPVLALEYADGSSAEIQGCWPIQNTFTTTVLGTGTTPDVLGMRLRMPVPCRARGAWVWADLDGDCAVKLVSESYHQANNTGVLAARLLSAAARNTTLPAVSWVEFPASITLAVGTWYRLVVEPTTAATLSLYDYPVASLALLDATPGGRDWHLTTAKDPTGDGDWTNFNSGTFRKPMLGLILDAFDDGVGGGGGFWMSG